MSYNFPSSCRAELLLGHTFGTIHNCDRDKGHKGRHSYSSDTQEIRPDLTTIKYKISWERKTQKEKKD